MFRPMSAAALWAALALALSACAGTPPAVVETPEPTLPADPNPDPAAQEDHKFVIYQMMTRLFGNTKTANIPFGTLEENGVGRFADITPKALTELKDLGTTMVWYTGVIEHATMDDWSAYGIEPDDSDVIKGRAGSPYAIKDYYDVNPNLAVDPRRRMAEFEALVARTHAAGLKVMIDFVPNHVARRYISDAKPAGVEDFGARDDTSVEFAVNNNFYYIPGQEFWIPNRYNPLGPDILAINEDGLFAENPAKATGNDRFTRRPSSSDWFETVKLNYGIDISRNRAKHFDVAAGVIPDTWLKMRDILVYWARKGVDGFRVDMAEMVPPEFFGWVIPQVKAVRDVTFLAEIYQPRLYKEYMELGRFDYLYDKVGLYDTLKPLIQGSGNPARITQTDASLPVPNHQMLRFLENHDEMRIASDRFGKSAEAGLGAMVVSATLGSGPVMIYFGQEVGEPGKGVEGFGGEDGRTTIFDYWGVPHHQRWVNNGAFDGGQLSEAERTLRSRYRQLLRLVQSAPAFRSGAFYELDWANRSFTEGYPGKAYAYLRWSGDSRYLVVVNFDLANAAEVRLRIPPRAWEAMGLSAEGAFAFQDALLWGRTEPFVRATTDEFVSLDRAVGGLKIDLPAGGAAVFQISPEGPGAN